MVNMMTENVRKYLDKLKHDRRDMTGKPCHEVLPGEGVPPVPPPRDAEFQRLCARVRFTATKGNKEARWSRHNKPGQRNQHYRCALSMEGGRRITCDWWQSINATAEGKAPTCADVMHSLLSDASCYESEPNIDDFAANFGGDKTPISETIAAFKACKNRARSCRNFWGDLYDAAQEAASEY